MYTQITSMWQSILGAGVPFLPYLALFILCVVFLIVIGAIAYVLYKAIKRAPITFRYVIWRIQTLVRRLHAAWLQGRNAQLPDVYARVGNADALVIMRNSFLNDQNSRQSRVRRAFFSWREPQRSSGPVFLVMGPDGAGKSTLIQSHAAEKMKTEFRGKKADVTWTKLSTGLALEVSASLITPEGREKFVSMLRTLDRMYPEHPLDAIVVVLPVSMAESSPQEIISIADAVRCVSSELGRSFPVHLILTKADKWLAFESLVALRKEQKSLWQPLGMSHPFNEEVVDAQKYIEEFKQDVKEQLNKAVMANPNWRSNFALRDVWTLPNDINRLSQSLLELLSHLGTDRASDVAKPCVCDTLITGFSTKLLKESSQHVFIKDAAQERIFVARPDRFKQGEKYNVMSMRERHERNVKTGLVVGCVAIVLWGIFTWQQISQEWRETRKVANQLKQEISQTMIVEPADFSALEDQLDAINRLDRIPRTFLLVPASWFDDSQERLLASLGALINEQWIQPRLQRLLKEESSSAIKNEAPWIALERIDELASYKKLDNFLANRELEKNSNDIDARQNQELPFSELIRFLGYEKGRLKNQNIEWDQSLPKALTKQFHFKSLSLVSSEEAVERVLPDVWNRLIDDVLDRHPLVVIAKEISTNVPGAQSGQFNIAEAQHLGALFKQLQSEVQKPSARRVLGNKADALSFFSKAQIRIARSSIVSSRQAAELINRFNERFEDTHSELMGMQIQGVGPIFVLESQKDVLALSPEFKRFSSAYTTFISQPFMRSPAYARSDVVLKSNQYIKWSQPTLEPIRQLGESYRDFVSLGSAVFEPQIRSALLRLSRNNLVRLYDEVFVSAMRVSEDRALQQSTSSEKPLEAPDDLRQFSERIRNLTITGKYLKSMHVSLDELALDSNAANGLYFQEVKRLLFQLENKLQQDDPYGVLARGVDQWFQGDSINKPLTAYIGSGYSDQLAVSREHIRNQYLVLLSPLFESISPEMMANNSLEELVRWRRMRDIFDGYDKGSTNNGIYAIENYLHLLVALSSAESCHGFLRDRKMPTPRSDYFSQKLVTFDASVVKGCAQRSQQLRMSEYQAFSDWFNTNVAGRTPFVSGRWQSSMRPLSLATYEGLTTRYRSLRNNLSSYGGKEVSAWPSSVVLFLAQMDSLVNQLDAKPSVNRQEVNSPNLSNASSSSLVSSAKNDVPFRAQVVFRSERQNESGADQIVDWRLLCGRRDCGNGADGQEFLNWKVGEPIELRLRWAMNGPVTPLVGGQSALPYTVTDRTAVFTYKGDWGGLEMIQRHRVSRPPTADGRVTLLFIVSTIGPKGRESAKVYMTLIPPEGKRTLFELPSKAPDLRVR